MVVVCMGRGKRETIEVLEEKGIADLPALMQLCESLGRKERAKELGRNDQGPVSLFKRLLGKNAPALY